MFGREDEKMLPVFIGVYLALWIAGLTQFNWSVNTIIIVGTFLLQSLLLQVSRVQRKKLLDQTVSTIENDETLNDEDKMQLLPVSLLTLLDMKDK